ncbi:MAG: thioesterase family protein [Pseudomonadota bacterium]
MSAEVPKPYRRTFTVKPAWLDENDHMNVAYYLSALDDGSEALFEDIALGWEYTRDGAGTIFVASCNIDFRRELLSGDNIEVRTQLLAFDSKRIHCYLSVHNADEAYLAAEAEQLYLHMSLATRRPAPIPEGPKQRLAEIERVHRELPIPPFVGRKMGMDWKPK